MGDPAPTHSTSMQLRWRKAHWQDQVSTMVVIRTAVQRSLASRDPLCGETQPSLAVAVLQVRIQTVVVSGALQACLPQVPLHSNFGCSSAALSASVPCARTTTATLPQTFDDIFRSRSRPPSYTAVPVFGVPGSPAQLRPAGRDSGRH